MSEIELGDRVQDRITKQKGIVIGLTRWLYGCVRVTIQPEEVKDNKPVDGFCIDLPQCILVEKGVICANDVVEKQKVKTSGGPRPDASRGCEITTRNKR